MRMLLAVLSVLLLAACAGSAGHGGVTAAHVLVNRTPNAFVYLALDSEVAQRIDVNPFADPAAMPERVVAAGAEVEIEVELTSDLGVTVILYEIPAGHAGGRVPLTRTVVVTRQELEASGGRIVVEPR
jgi:hypothetical protein